VIEIEIRRAARRIGDRLLLWRGYQAPGSELRFDGITSQIRGAYSVTWTARGPRGGRHVLRTLYVDADGNRSMKGGVLLPKWTSR
jgi:hypothetical protein